jgi:ubiquinone/menaquinone biosynthesis C-methylase UbiE
MHFDRPFDAIIGRFVLMYQDDPETNLRNMMRYLREGGVVAFQELDSTACRSWPAVPIFDEAASIASNCQQALSNLPAYHMTFMCPIWSQCEGYTIPRYVIFHSH